MTRLAPPAPLVPYAPHIRRIVLLAIAVVFIAGCGSVQHVKSPRPARINHVVLFKLKNPADAPDLIAECDRKLSKIPGVVSYFCGTHLDTGRGDRVDSNYDVAFYVGFNSQEDYDRYVRHPDHIAAVDKWKPRWEWIRIHDVLDDTP